MKKLNTLKKKVSQKFRNARMAFENFAISPEGRVWMNQITILALLMPTDPDKIAEMRENDAEVFANLAQVGAEVAGVVGEWAKDVGPELANMAEAAGEAFASIAEAAGPALAETGEVIGKFVEIIADLADGLA